MTPGSPPILSPLGHLSLNAGQAGMSDAIGKDNNTKGGPVSPTSPLSVASGADAVTTSTATGATASPSRPPMQTRLSTGLQLPGGWWSGWNKDKEAEGSEAGAAAAQAAEDRSKSQADEHLSTPTAAPAATTATPTPAAAPVTPASALPPHLTPSKQQSARRISFLSPTDLLLSVPTQVTALGEITSGHLAPEHLPGTISPSLSPTPMPGPGGGASARSPGVPSVSTFGGAGLDLVRSSSPSLGTPGGSSATGGGSPTASTGAGAGASVFAGKEAPVMLGPAHTTGGEWGREGLGKGLEQRLEDLVQGGGSR